MDNAAYSKLLAPITQEHRAKPYSFWLPFLSGEPIVREIVAPDGTPCCVEINAFWDDKPNGDIRVILSIDDGGRDALMPYGHDFILSPDGSFVGE